MSRFSGPQGRGAQRAAREQRMYDAYLRQIDGRRREQTKRGKPWLYADFAQFLSRAATEQMASGRLDIESCRRAS